MIPYGIDMTRCTFCAGCASICPVMAIEIRDHEAVITGACIGCGKCALFCPISAAMKQEEFHG